MRTGVMAALATREEYRNERMRPLSNTHGRHIRKISFATCMACATLFVSVLTMTVSPAAGDLVGLWRFDDPSTPGADSSAKGNTLYPHGDAKVILGSAGFGGVGGAGSFDGSGDYFGIEYDTVAGSHEYFDRYLSGIPVGNAPYTISAQIKRADADVLTAVGIVGWGLYGSGNPTMNHFLVGSYGGALANQWWAADLQRSWSDADPDIVLDQSEFTHVAVVYDPTASPERFLYAAGGQLGTGDNPVDHQTTTQTFRIGVVGPTWQYWKGQLDDIAVFNEALTLSQLATIGCGDFSAFGVAGGCLVGIPEPSSFVLTMLALTGWASVCHRRQRN